MSAYSVQPYKEFDSLSGYPILLQSLLMSRGITNRIDAEAFFNPSFEDHVHDPFLLKDMDKAVSRIIDAITNSQKVVIYSDYDADGIPGGTMLRDFFEKIGHSNIDTYIPHRHDEGFGLHADAVQGIIDSGADLIISVDCGITDVLAAEKAKERNIDLIITDHHEAGSILPDAYAIINPKQPGCTYPEKILCGAGVAYKLVQGILEKNRFGLKEGHEKWLLDLVGIATLSDMVPLTGENRAFAHFGLTVLRKSPRPGLQALWKQLRINQRFVNEDDIGFSFSPRINAASRMGHPMDAYRLLSAKTLEEGHTAAEHLEHLNNERKGIVASIVKEAKKTLREREKISELPRVVVIGNPHWKPSLLGLVANSLVEDIKRPVFLWGRNGDDTLKGSCRSDGVTNLVDLMNSVHKSFIQFGGHAFAGGFAVSLDAIHTLEEQLSISHKSLCLKSEQMSILVDAELSLQDINWNTFDQIQKLAPFGTGNPRPLFAFPHVVIASTKQFGGDKNHLEIILNSTSGKSVKGIKFFSNNDSFETPIVPGQIRTIVGSLEKSTFGRGGPELRIRIADII